MKKHKVFVGDTLVEVMFAVGIFCLVAIGVVSVMNSSSSKIQQSLEITMTRNEIDTQAEALRYIHSSYNSERNQKEAGNIYSTFWKKIIDPSRVVPEDKVDSVLNYQPSSCSALYSEEGEARKYGFIIDYRHLGDILSNTANATTLNNLIIDKDKLKTATLYPRILYGVDDTLYSSSSGNIKSAEGLYIIAVADIRKTNVVQESDDEDAAAVVQSAFYDFYIRSCWQAPGSNQPTLTSTLIRLNDPDLQGVKFQLETFELRFHNVVGGVGEVPGTMSALDKTPQYTFLIPDTPIPMRLRDRKNAIGWIRDPGENWNGVGACPEGKFYRPGSTIDVSAANPSVDLYAVFECRYVLYFYTDSTSTSPYHRVTHDQNVTEYQFDYDEDGVKPEINPTKPGYTFIGWSNDKKPDYNGENTEIIAHKSKLLSVPGESVASAYAIFRPNYNISFNLNGGEGTTPDPRGGESSVLCTEFDLPTFTDDDIPTKTGFVFAGWSTKQDATVTEFANNKIYMPYGCNNPSTPRDEYRYDVELFAVWSIYDREITVVLEWSSADYDSHVYGTLRNNTPFHAYYGKKGISEDNDDPVAELDHDRTSGGTETFKLHTYGGKTYYYSVYNYSGRGARITNNAKVTVTVHGTPSATYTYKASDVSGTGYWHVFAYKGGKIVPCNKYSNSYDTPPAGCYQ